MIQTSVAAIVLAGGSQDNLSRHFGVQNKALVPIHGKPMAYYVLKALKESRLVNLISYVGEVEDSFASFADVVSQSGVGMAESLLAGTQTLQSYDYYLVLSADLPWLSAKAVDEFISQSPQADLVYTIVAREVLERQFPGQKRTYVKIREGVFSGGNVILLSRAALPALLKLLNQLHQARKNPLKLAQLFGWDMIIKLLLGRLQIPELETRASRILGVQARAFIAADAGLGSDIDKLEHLQSSYLQDLVV